MLTIVKGAIISIFAMKKVNPQNSTESELIGVDKTIQDAMDYRFMKWQGFQ